MKPFLLLLLFLPSLQSFTPAFSLIKSKKAAIFQTWQEDVDSLLNIDTECDSRRNIAFRLIDKISDIQNDVVNAIQDRDIKKIAPPSLKYGKAIEGVQAFQRQLINDIVPDLLTKTIPKAVEIGPKIMNEFIQIAPEKTKELINNARDITQDASLLQSTVDDLRKEIRNIFLSTPEGLQTPEYTVLNKTDNYEIRNYATYSVCSTKLTSESSSSSPSSSSSSSTSTSFKENEMLDPINSGNGFNILASYIFGKNTRKEKMSMTTPVIIENNVMEFVLPKGMNTNTAPSPDTDNIIIKDVPSEIVAVREFPGIATEGEVSRQRAYLEDSLLSDGVNYDNLSFKVLQYNPPYTLPWLRRNEVSVRVTDVLKLQSDFSPSDTSTRSESNTMSKDGDASAFFTSPEAGD